ncbi:MAG: RNA-binding protein [Thermoanaerobaculia bacterium]|nr:RNA-binding protein [Thermoanaerobaculia bacterium]
MSSKRVFVGNLSYGIDEKRLAEYFGEVGRVVSVRIPTDDSERSRGFAFVEFASAEEAGFAVQVYDGRRFAGRELKVRPAHAGGSARAEKKPARQAQIPPAWERDDDAYDDDHRGRKPIRDWRRLRGTKRAL